MEGLEYIDPGLTRVRLTDHPGKMGSQSLHPLAPDAALLYRAADSTLCPAYSAQADQQIIIVL